MKLFFVIIFIILLIVLLGCHFVGSMFIKNLKRKNGEKEFTPNIDISFYKNGPLNDLIEKGVAYIKTLPHKDVNITAVDGIPLHAYLFPCKKPSKTFVIGSHGFQSHGFNEFSPHIDYYHSMNCNLLLVDNRGHSLSGGKYITMGVKDRLDLVQWAKYLVHTYGKDIRIILHGVSMGGASVLSASGEKDLPKQVVGIVSDCGYSSINEVLHYQIHQLVPFPANFVIPICKWYAKHVAHFDFDEGEPIEAVKRTNVPILFVSGTKDVLVPVEMVKKLYASCHSKKQLFLVEEANHAESIGFDPDGFHREITKLLQLSE